MVELTKVIIPPVRTEVDGVVVDILEVLKLRDDDYHVTCIARFKDVSSRKFFISARDTEEFKAKLRVEVAKLKLAYYVGGKEFAKEVVG